MPNKVITTTEISERLNTSEGHTRKVIMEINRLQRDLILRRQCYDEKRRMGRPRTAYYLNQDGIAVMPETALILIELSRFQTEKPFRINQRAFERHMNATHGLSVKYVREKIEEAIGKGYVEVKEDNYIYPSPRTSCEAKYLGLIASEIRD